MNLKKFQKHQMNKAIYVAFVNYRKIIEVKI